MWKNPFLRGALALALPGSLFAQVASLEITVVEGQGAVYGAGSRSPRPLTVRITDEAGRPVEGAAVNFLLPEEGPGGSLANGMRSDVVISDARGRASLRGLQLNRTPGAFRIRVTASKDHARAGMVLRQSIAGAASATRAAKEAGKRGRKWVLVALATAGAAGGLAAGLAGKGSPAAPKPAPAPPPTVTIGTPVVTVGAP